MAKRNILHISKLNDTNIRYDFIRCALLGGNKIQLIPNEENVELIDMAINALEKQIVKNVVGIHHSTNDEENSVYGEDARFGQCPSCGELISSVWNKEYCGDCGQKLDWSDEE